MAAYTYPGVYVEEVPSAIMPIAGVGTSIAAFIGVSADITGTWTGKWTQPAAAPAAPATAPGSGTVPGTASAPAAGGSGTAPGTATAPAAGDTGSGAAPGTASPPAPGGAETAPSTGGTPAGGDAGGGTAPSTGGTAAAGDAGGGTAPSSATAPATGDAGSGAAPGTTSAPAAGDPSTAPGTPSAPATGSAGTVTAPAAGASTGAGASTAGGPAAGGPAGQGGNGTGSAGAAQPPAGMPADPAGNVYPQAAPLTPTPVNSWTEFTQGFGDIQQANEFLAQAVYGFFNNGGTRCWVVRIASAGDVTTALQQLESIDEITIVAVPLPPDTAAAALTQAQAAVITHCENMQDRVAILDSPSSPDSSTRDGVGRPGSVSSYAAFYYPWILVADPLNQSAAPVAVPPSGHLAGIYARSDAERGVWKAPANEVILGALGVQYPLSKADQGPLNLDGVNCIRSFSGTIKVYGARTLASDVTGQGDPEWQYISVRRLVIYLRESIDTGTQWVVFEPNAADLWSRIRRNVSAFLTTEWAAGALVGATADQAFYVRCDDTLNTPAVQALGQVITEIGVAVVRPAEFVVFRLSQWAGPGQ